MKKALMITMATAGMALLTSCDTSGLANAIAQANQGSSYGPPSYRDDRGYSPYRPVQEVDGPRQKRHAYQVGYRIGADDFNHGYQKKYMRHSDMYDSNTRQEFKDGYYAGYERERENRRRYEDSRNRNQNHNNNNRRRHNH